MEKIMTWENIHLFAQINDAVCTKPIKGILLWFNGLNFTKFLTEDDADSVLYGEKGILRVIPLYNPWGWMNDQAVACADEILDVLFEHYALSEDTPLISTGSSMGGLAALTYMAKAKRTPGACLANCPVCDLPYHFTERPDLPRTLYSAFRHYGGTMEAAMKTASPVHLVPEMPEAEYTVFHGDADRAVNKERHSDRFVSAMREAGREVDYIEIPGRDHALLSGAEKEYFDAAIFRFCGV